MGGSLIKKGGQNMIEPAFFSKPILVGPHTFNFRDIVSLFMKEKAIWVVKDETSFEKAVSSILKDPSLGKALGKRARLIAESNKGTTAVAVKAIDEILTTRCV
jgi:3-deoxy-D-manno-octulosonic-acid transferase